MTIEQFETDEGCALRAEFDQAWAAARDGTGPAPGSATPPVTSEEARARMNAYIRDPDGGIYTYVMVKAWTDAMDEIDRLRPLAEAAQAIWREGGAA